MPLSRELPRLEKAAGASKMVLSSRPIGLSFVQVEYAILPSSAEIPEPANSSCI